MKEIYKKLIKSALKARLNSYSPYSKFKVGSALYTEKGEVFTGCNIENSSFSLTVCAERVALFKAVSEGKKRFKYIAVVGTKNPCFPCGACLQTLFEFSPEIKIILKKGQSLIVYPLKKLLPYGFRK